MTTEFTPTYESWRHGGWYVTNVSYPSGAVGCVSRNYGDRKWRIVCDPRNEQPTFKSRDDAAHGERDLIESLRVVGEDCTCSIIRTDGGYDLDGVLPCFKHSRANVLHFIGVASERKDFRS